MQRARLGRAADRDHVVVDLAGQFAEFGGETTGHAAAANVADPSGALNPLGLLAVHRFFHEAGPGRDRHNAREGTAPNRLRLIVANPDTGGEPRREADEPRIRMVVGRAGLAAGRKLEPVLARAVAGAV